MRRSIILIALSFLLLLLNNCGHKQNGTVTDKTLKIAYNVLIDEDNADYDFINEIDNVTKQQFIIESVTSGFVKSINIENAGENYKVGDKLSFTEEGTSGSGSLR